MPSADQVPVKCPHSTMRWRKWVVLIAESTGSALRAVRPFQPSHHAGCPTRSLSRRKRDGFLIALAPGHHRPCHSGNLVGERDGSDLGGPTRQQGGKPGSMLGAMDFRVADHGERAGREQAAQIAIALFADAAKLVFASARVLLGHEADPGREVPPRSEALGSAMLATKAVANTGPTPGISSSRLLVSFDRCQAMIRRSNASIWAFSASNWVPRAATHARAISGSRVSFASATTSSNCSTPLRPTGATIPNSARCARIELMMAVCWRMKRCRVR